MAGKLSNLTALRFFAAFSIFLHHLDALGLNFSKHLWNLNLGVGVSFFYVLSGFVLALSYKNSIRTFSDISNFAMIRFFRLWPLHVVCGLLAILCLGIQPDFLRGYLFLFLQHAWVPSYGTAFYINGVSWSISVEMFFYLVFPFLVMASTPRVMAIFGVLAAALLALVALVSLRPDFLPFAEMPKTRFWEPTTVSATSFFHLFPPVRLLEFICGILTFRFFDRVRLHADYVPAMQTAVVILMLFYVPMHHAIAARLGAAFPGPSAEVYSRLGPFPLFALVVYAFAHQSGAWSRLLSIKLLVYLGEISFAFYLVHQIAIRVTRNSYAVQGLSDSLAGAAISFIASLAIAALLYELIEKPSLRAAKRVFVIAR
jgi:peptidoglycan/LPS O-acetylase OafA/YrhL